MRRIFDPLHGFILLNEHESALIDTLPFQRLRYIRQLGSAYLVYPGATHTRFEHSLGTMELASRIFDRVVASVDTASWLKNIAYAKQIVRLAALCHDLGHLPFSHVAEELVLGHEGHEKWTIEIIESVYLAPVWEQVSKSYPDFDVAGDVVKLAVGEKKLQQLGKKSPFTKWHQALEQIIAGDFFGADRIDYLLRDARNTGVSYGMFDYHQLIETIRILPGTNNNHLEMGIDEGGIEACEALLLARHFMHRRVYQYESVKSLAFHLARYIGIVLGEDFASSSLSTYLQWTDNEILKCMREAMMDTQAPGHHEALCLAHRAKRCYALSLHNFDINILESIMKNFPKGSMSWEGGGKKKGEARSFPVLRRNGDVVSSSKMLQVSIPSPQITWVYIAPEYAKELESKLSEYASF